MTAVNADIAVHDGIVYVGSKDNNMYALYASSGRKKWSYNAHSDVTSGAVFSDDGETVYLGTDSTGFFALDTEDGSKRWSYEPDRIGQFAAKPTVYQDIVIAAADGRVYAFDADRSSENLGELAWVNPRLNQDTEWGRFRESGVAYRDAFYIGSDDGTLHGFHTSTGGRNGTARLRGSQMPYYDDDDGDLEPIRSAVVINGPDIYFGNDAGELIQYTGNSISWVFHTESKRDVRGDIASTQNIVVFGDRSGAIYGVNPDREEAAKRRSTDKYETPDRVWIEYIEDDRWIAGGPVISGNYVYVIDSYGELYMIDLARGRTIHRLDLWSGDDPCVSCSSTPAIEGDMLFAGTQDGTIVGVQLPVEAK